jgi:TolA-binding protein
MATQKKESAKTPRRMVKESELQQAQVVLAAQDMIDRIQGMIEDISEMQFKDLPALTDSVKNDMGTEQATQFQSATSAALSQLLTAIQAGKTQMESAQGVLTGQAPIVPGDDADMDMDLNTDGAEDIDVDAEIGADLPPREDEDDEENFGASLGRERR